MIWTSVSFALTLDEAWEATLAHGEEARIAEEIARQGQIVETQAWTSLGPRVSASGNFIYNERETTINFAENFPPEMLELVEQFTGEPLDLGEPVVINEQSYFDASVSIIQPLLNLRAFPGLAAARAMAQAGDANGEAMLGQLHLGVVQAYTGAWLAREAEVLARAALESARQHDAAMASFVSVGAAAPLSKLQTEVGVRRAERELAAARLRRQDAELSLAALCNTEPGGEVSLPEPPSLPFATEADALAAAQTGRPELRAARANGVAARSTAAASVLQWAPTVDARFTEAWTQNEGFSGEPSAWQFALTASFPVWDAGYRVADNQRAVSNARQADAALDKVEEETAALVRGLWAKLSHARLGIAAADAEVVAARESLRLAETGLRLGASTPLEAEDAAVGVQSAELALASARVNEVVTAYAILALAGR